MRARVGVCEAKDRDRYVDRHVWLHMRSLGVSHDTTALTIHAPGREEARRYAHARRVRA